MTSGTSPTLVDRANTSSGVHAEYSRRETVGLVISFVVLAGFAPAIGVPTMFVFLWAFSKANVIVHRVCLSLAVALLAYGVLFLSGVVTFTYWQ